MTKLLIADTADVTIKRKSDGVVFISAETQLASITTSLGIDDKVFGGLGNKALAVFKGQKNIESQFRNAFYDGNFLAMTQGVSMTSGTATIIRKVNDLEVKDNAGTLEVTLPGSVTATTGWMTVGDGETEEVAIATGKVTVPVGSAKEGENVSVSYEEEITGADIVELDATKFAEAYTLEYHTIGYDPQTNKVVKDIYIQLDHAVPKGDFTLSFEAGTPIAPEVTFDVLAEPNSDKMGRVIEVERV